MDSRPKFIPAKAGAGMTVLSLRTIDDQFSKETSFWQQLLRDFRLLKRIGRMVFAYFTEGRRIRRLYRQKQAQGEIFWVDEEVKS